MNRLALSFMLLSAFLFTLISPSSMATSIAEWSPFAPIAIRVEPSPASTSLGDTLKVNITVSDISDFAAWEFKLYWLKGRLNGTSILEGVFLRKAGPTYFEITNFTDNYNSTHGVAWVSDVLLGPGPGAYGSGVIASLSFKSKSIGSTGLWLRETMLLDSAARVLPHVAISGISYVTFHNIAVTKVKLWKTVVGQGYTVKVNATVQNQGNFTETINVTARANGTIFATLLNPTLPSGLSTATTFIWNTTGFAYGNYTVSAYAYPVPNETDLADNTFTDGTVIVSHVGDITGDGKVDIQDLARVSGAFGSLSGMPKWNPLCDINDDGKVDVQDLARAGANFGWHR